MPALRRARGYEVSDSNSDSDLDLDPTKAVGSIGRYGLSSITIISVPDLHNCRCKQYLPRYWEKVAEWKVVSVLYRQDNLECYLPRLPTYLSSPFVYSLLTQFPTKGKAESHSSIARMDIHPSPAAAYVAPLGIILL